MSQINKSSRKGIKPLINAVKFYINYNTNQILIIKEISINYSHNNPVLIIKIQI